MKRIGTYRCFVFVSALITQFLPALVSANTSSFEPPVPPEELFSSSAPVPNFGSIPDVKIKKSEFFDYLLARTRIANDHIWAERQYVIDYQERQEEGFVSLEHQAGFEALVIRYKMTMHVALDQAFFAALLSRVDVVPASLVLAQGAKESAWGTSRFGTEGRNFFGVWCYQEGCGIKPKSRAPGAKHEVRKFKTVLEGVAHYIHNINVGHAYEDLRLIRQQLRAEGDELSGVRLAEGLIKYSERREAYVNEIKALIQQNKLSRFNLRRDRSAANPVDVPS